MNFSQGLNALEQGKADSAITFFLSSFQESVPRESLYYYMAEAFIQKSVYDTALAFNFGTQTQKKQDLYYDILKQRYKIYTALKLYEDAQQIRDTLNFYLENVTMIAEAPLINRSWSPYIRLKLSSGYFDENLISQEIYPFDWDIDFSNKDERGPDNSVYIRAEWKHNIFSDKTILFGGKVKASQEYDKEYFDHDYSMFAGIENLLFKNLSFTYTFLYDLKSADSRSPNHSFDANYFKMDAKSLSFVSLGYNGERGKQPEDISDFFWLMYFWDCSIKNGSGPGFSAILSRFSIEPYTYEYTATLLYADDIQKSPEPTFFTDSNYTTEVNYQGLGIMRRNNISDSLLAYSKEIQLHWSLPQDFYQAEFELNYSLKTFYGATAGIGINGSFKYFPREYYIPESGSWMNDPDPLGQPWVIYNKQDGKYYGVENKESTDNTLLASKIRTSPLDNSVKQRRDQSGKLSFFVKKRFLKFGYFYFYSFIEKNWSSLADQAPMDLPDLDMGLAISWQKTFFY
ncbi:MAG: hypothetical protein HQK83_04750 [Fibrobacteria bacterium]|nr:hypothetical protein [Fibrobacteria bacterium]